MSSSRMLRVTLLSSEWKSTEGGLSTINRELAMQFARHPSVKVSVYLPQCSEEDREVASGHNVHLIEAEELAGFESINWLSFLPEDHLPHCVIGHGLRLGRQIPLIKRQHDCKWIQVVHAAHEELGMFKSCEGAISKGVQKHQAEVKLCELADQVVAIGPKLADTYSRNLRSSGRDQDVLNLTPGIFSEFYSVKQATEERKKFCVLVFGRGDDEDFELKGYDIAVQAIAKLKDKSYQLMFVGAPEGKEEEVRGKLLQHGISASQLTVRRFNESREQLAKLFCEVDLAIMPSKTEGFGLTALEAVSAGLPVIVSGNSGLGEVLKEVPSGSQSVMDSENADEWAKAIKSVRDKDRELRLEEAKILREKYAEKYSWEKQCECLIERMLDLTFDAEERVKAFDDREGKTKLLKRNKSRADIQKLLDGLTPMELSTLTSSDSGLQMEKGESRPGTDVHRPASRIAKRILQNSEKVSDGPPPVYKLPTKIALKGVRRKIVRKSIGSPSNVLGGRTEKVLMVVGATGAGKTTLINGMVNYILGVEWKDDFRYKLVIEDNKVSQAHSQTKDITAYTFYPMKGSAVPYTFTIIDTPGFGDTEGLERDRQITNQIKEFFSIPHPDDIDHLDGIGFVTQASLARLTPFQEYIFDTILSIFGKDVTENIFMLVTFADGQPPPVMEAIKKVNIPSQKYYKFNNFALYAENTEENEDSFDAMFWKMGVRSFKNFFAEFEKSESVSLQLTQEVLKEREQLQTLIEGLKMQISMGLSKIEEMRQEENVIEQFEREIESCKSFTYKVESKKARVIDLRGRHATTCLRCNYTCHINYTCNADEDRSHCPAFGSDGNCTVCPMHCYWAEHRNLPYLIEYETVTETRTSDDLKRRYETAVSRKRKVQGMIEQLEDDLMKVHTKKVTMIIKAQECLRRLDEIALKPNPMTQLQYLELLIESEKNEAKPGWQKRVQYYEEAKRQAEMLSKVKHVKATEKGIKEKARSGDEWYSKFKFW